MMRKMARWALVLALLPMVMGAATACPEESNTPKTIENPRTATIEAWTVPDGPFQVTLLGVDKSGKLPRVRYPANEPFLPVAGGTIGDPLKDEDAKPAFRYYMEYTSGTFYTLEVTVFGAPAHVTVHARVIDGGSSSHRYAKSIVVLEWTTVQ